MLKRFACVASALAILIMAAAADETVPSVKDVMNKLHKGANSPINTVKAQLKSPNPDWKKIQDASKDFVILGAALAKNDPPKGDKAGWNQLANAYFDNSKALDDAARAEDKAKTQAALGKIGASCKACHVAHKGK